MDTASLCRNQNIQDRRSCNHEYKDTALLNSIPLHQSISFPAATHASPSYNSPVSLVLR